MKIINNQVVKAICFISFCQFALFGCQNNTAKSTNEATSTKLNPLFNKKSNLDTIAINDIWLVKDADLEKGEVLRAYKISSMSSDSIKYVKSKIVFDTTSKNWQIELTKQLNYDVNIQFRVHKTVKDKWLASNKIISIYYK